jgi:DNA-binding NarL/FixJ family response regulator
MRDGLAAILEGTPGFQCVCACATAEEALDAIPRATPNVVLMDINLPGDSGIACVRALKQQQPALQIVMLTVETDSQRVFESLEAGASGYLVKNVPPAGILEAIAEVQRGGAPMSGLIARLVVQTFHRRHDSSPNATERLTEREQDILRLFAAGHRTKQVAADLGIGDATVETHVRRIYDKLHVRSRAEAVARYLRRNP